MMWAVFKFEQLVRGPYESRDEALAQAFEVGAMPVNPGYQLAESATTDMSAPLYKEAHIYRGYEIRQV